MAGTDVTIIPVIYHTYKVADIAAMNALTGMRTSELCTVDSTGETYRYDGTSWELIISTLVGIVWDETAPRVLNLTGQTSNIPWADLDLAAHISAKAKIVFLWVTLTISAFTSGNLNLRIRKKGTTPGNYPTFYPWPYEANAMACQFGLCGVDTDEIMQYDVGMSGTLTYNLFIDLLGYLE